MSLLICLDFFHDTESGDGRLTAGGAKLTEGALLDSGKSSYRGTAQLSHQEKLHLLPRESAEISARKLEKTIV
jgi:hypothetical protein